MTRGRFARVGAVLLVAVGVRAQAPIAYQKPPEVIRRILEAPAPPVARMSPRGDRVLLAEPVHYPTIAELARPMLRLAGVRMDPANFGPHNPRTFRHLELVELAGASPRVHPIALPAELRVSLPEWSPDGRRLFFVSYGAQAVELWWVEAATAAAHRVAGLRLNATLGPPCRWWDAGSSLLCRAVSTRSGGPPPAPTVPTGPIVQQTSGVAAPVRTYEDLLTSPHDEDLFDYYATAQLVRVRLPAGQVQPLGRPGVVVAAAGAPGGRYLLVETLHRPYSYLVPYERFPRRIEVWDATGRRVQSLADLPLAEAVPIEGVRTGPRNVHWMAGQPATLVWTEALDGGDPERPATARDRLMRWSAPFADPPQELARFAERLLRVDWGAAGDFGLARELDQRRQQVRWWVLDPRQLGGAPRLFREFNARERYRNPGQPLLVPTAGGEEAIVEQPGAFFLVGPGASPEGDRPFLDRCRLETLQVERLFRSDAAHYEEVLAVAADGAWLTRRESPTEPPNIFLRRGEQLVALSHYADPAPALRGVRRQLVRYQRADGVPLSMLLYLPPDYRPGERRPAVLWAYPLEYTDPTVAGEVSGSPNRFLLPGGPSELFFLLDGYVVLDNAAMPVVGDPKTVNDTYLEQIVADARAAIEKAAALGVIDPQRVGVGGHSYGAFMTANLLAHSDLFRAGIARSGAYNRTLTPFGFQNERRTLWQAPELYWKVSPFMYADRIRAPLLLIHGDADDNPGTFPIQSERMYAALKGNGGTARYVRLPAEAHGYAALETIEHVVWEQLAWFGRYVKGAGAAAQQ